MQRTSTAATKQNAIAKWQGQLWAGQRCAHAEVGYASRDYLACVGDTLRRYAIYYVISGTHTVVSLSRRLKFQMANSSLVNQAVTAWSNRIA